jgi:hypothetical protein
MRNIVANRCPTICEKECKRAMERGCTKATAFQITASILTKIAMQITDDNITILIVDLCDFIEANK